MSKGPLLDMLKNIQQEVEKAEEFRKLSNRKVHVFSANVEDVKEQVRAEITKRLMAKTAKKGKTKKSKSQGTKLVRGGLGLATEEEARNHVVFKKIDKVLDKEIPKVVENIFNMLGGNPTLKDKLVTIQNVQYEQRGNGNKHSFTFVLSQIDEKKQTDVFNRFKDTIKQKAQVDLIDAVADVIEDFNKSNDLPSDINPISNIQEFAPDGTRSTAAGTSLLPLGHEPGSSITEQRVQTIKDELFSFEKSIPAEGELKKLFNAFKTEYFFFVEKFDTIDLTEVKFGLESDRLNSATFGKEEVQAIEKKFKAAVEALEAGKYVNLKGSDSRAEIIEKRIINELVKGLPKGAKVQRRLSKNIEFSDGKRHKAKTSKAKVTKKPLVKGKKTFNKQLPPVGGKRGKRKGGVSSVPLDLLGIMNQRLPETVRKHMTPPALQNQTGRFADSVRVTEINTTAKGFPSIGYTYDRDNYGQYEASSGSGQWANAERDPRKLIDRSIREIAMQAAIGRFFTRRV